MLNVNIYIYNYIYIYIYIGIVNRGLLCGVHAPVAFFSAPVAFQPRAASICLVTASTKSSSHASLPQGERFVLALRVQVRVWPLACVCNSSNSKWGGGYNPSPTVGKRRRPSCIGHTWCSQCTTHSRGGFHMLCRRILHRPTSLEHGGCRAPRLCIGPEMAFPSGAS